MAFESTSGQAIAAYATNASEIRYQTWTSGGGWSGELTGPDIGSNHIDTITLDSDPLSDSVMLSLVDGAKIVSFVEWDGSSFGTPSVLETDAGTAQG